MLVGESSPPAWQKIGGKCLREGRGGLQACNTSGADGPTGIVRELAVARDTACQSVSSGCLCYLPSSYGAITCCGKLNNPPSSKVPKALLPEYMVPTSNAHVTIHSLLMSTC